MKPGPKQEDQAMNAMGTQPKPDTSVAFVSKARALQEWYSAAELAALELPELPGTTRGVHDYSQRSF
ncbi:conserved hypothetical protein [Roseibium sp. TrichSKD4]|uniref:hypothetical protein n=1 Tax=Roseibium sp. TrichSKD4 TaxID=744980 RepID=UPI0001E56931|nr:hypothetical protein [Roseibium sp. TrichSKD4]EFO32465.1 conserved hypothetical protein [Roseibium sp. TrichSKD4]